MEHRRLLAATVILASVTLLTGCGKSPESAVESFYRSLASGEIADAKNHVSAELLDMAGDRKLSAALSEEAEKIKACGGIKNVEVKLQGEGEVRSGKSTITYGGKCPPRNENTKLIKEDGKWKITAGK